MSTEALIDGIRAKIARLVAENHRLESERNTMAQQQEKLRVENRQLREQAVSLERRVAKLELQGGLKGKDDNKAARARINRLMREVDKCIALLGK